MQLLLCANLLSGGLGLEIDRPIVGCLLPGKACDIRAYSPRRRGFGGNEHADPWTETELEYEELENFLLSDLKIPPGRSVEWELVDEKSPTDTEVLLVSPRSSTS